MVLPALSKKRMEEEIRIFSTIKNKLTRSDGTMVYAGGLLERAAQQFGSSTALFHEERSFSFEELYLRSLLLSKKLQNSGVVKRDKVFIFCENSVDFYISYFAAWQIGAIVVPVNIFLHSKELDFILLSARPKAIFVLEKFRSKFEGLDFIAQEQPHMFSQSDIDYETDITTMRSLVSDFACTTLDDDELCLLLYTSGTSGQPKGVMLSSKSIMTNALQGYARLMTTKNGENERFFCVLPLFHVFAQNACIWLPFIAGASVIVVRSIERKLILKNLEHKPTVFLGVPALYGLLCLMKDAPLDSVRLFISGADALPDKIRAGFSLVYGRKICSGYGLTEASPVVAVNTRNEERPTHCVGTPLTGISCQIRDDNGILLTSGSVGNLWIKGDNVMLGYYDDDEQTHMVLKDGWLNTGDLASLDHYGNVSICGRSKDIIIHKGFNIYPQEVENILLKHPAVFKAAVVGHDEDVSGQIPVAYIALREKDVTAEKNLQLFCRDNLASYKIPRKFIYLDDLPMNATGKVDKKQLRSSK